MQGKDHESQGHSTMKNSVQDEQCFIIIQDSSELYKAIGVVDPQHEGRRQFSEQARDLPRLSNAI